MKMSICFKVNLDFGRYGIDDMMFAVKDGSVKDGSDDDIFLVLVQYPFNKAKFNLEFFREQVFYKATAGTNLMGKWTWLCFTVDLEDLGASRMFMNPL